MRYRAPKPEDEKNGKEEEVEEGAEPAKEKGMWPRNGTFRDPSTYKPGGMSTKCTFEQVFEAFVRNEGRVYLTMQELDISRRTWLVYQRKWPELKEVKKMFKMKVTEALREKLIEIAMMGDTAALKWLLPRYAPKEFVIQRKIEHKVDVRTTNISIELTDEEKMKILDEVRKGWRDQSPQLEMKSEEVIEAEVVTDPIIEDKEVKQENQENK